MTLPHVTRDGSVSIAAMEERHADRDTTTAAVLLKDALVWGVKNRFTRTGNDAGDLAAVNRLRGKMHLPLFSIIPDRGMPADPLPPPDDREYLSGSPVPRLTAIPAKTNAPTHIAATSKRLREVLFQELDDLRSGKSNPQQAQAVAKVAHQIVATVRMEWELSRIEPPTVDGSVSPKLLSST